MINSHIKSLKLANHFTLAIPSNPTFPPSLQPTEEPFNQTYVANQLSSFHISHKIAEIAKAERQS